MCRVHSKHDHDVVWYFIFAVLIVHAVYFKSNYGMNYLVSLMVFQPLDGFISADAENASSQLTSFRHYLDTTSLLQQPPAISAMASTNHVQPSGIAMASSLVEAPMSHKLSGFPAQAAASGFKSSMCIVPAWFARLFSVVIVSLVLSTKEGKGTHQILSP